MAAFDSALEFYRVGKLLIDHSRDAAVIDDQVRWLREDLEDALLDVKQGVLTSDARLVEDSLIEASSLIVQLRRAVDEGDGLSYEEG